MKLIGLIKSKTREKILRFFFSNKEKKYYLRELERILKLPIGNIRRELISLEKLGLFKHEKIGNLVYYSLNEKSSFFGVVEDILLVGIRSDGPGRMLPKLGERASWIQGLVDFLLKFTTEFGDEPRNVLISEFNRGNGTKEAATIAAVPAEKRAARDWPAGLRATGHKYDGISRLDIITE